MSKIYEALRQAELDRANGKSPSDAGSNAATTQAVLDTEAAPAPALPNTPIIYPRVTPVERPRVNSALTSVADAKPVASAVMNELATGKIAEDSIIEASDLDLSMVVPQVWQPLLQQLPALEERGSSVEQFRSLRSRMQEFRDLNKLKSLLVSSGLPQEGKSFIAANLAISFARHKAGRVLLIDGDMRRATLHKLLGCEQGPGLTEYLAGDASIVEIMRRPSPDSPEHPLPGGLASLTFIPAGMEHDKAADLSGNHRFNKLIAAASPHFDWIVVDSSPVNLVSDGVNLARSCDAVLLVARAGVTKFEVAQRAVAELKSSKVLGLVLNAVTNPTAAGGYYGYDGYDGYDKVEA